LQKVNRKEDYYYLLVEMSICCNGVPGGDPLGSRMDASIAETLQMKLGREFLAQRDGAGGRLQYLEAHTVTDLANTVLGVYGWSSEILNISTVDSFEEKGVWNILVEARCRVTLHADHGGSFHDDVGHGYARNAKDRFSAHENARKAAVTDARKRALRLFGNVLGNCMGDKDYLRQVMQMPYGRKMLGVHDLYHGPSRDKDLESKKRKQEGGLPPSGGVQIASRLRERAPKKVVDDRHMRDVSMKLEEEQYDFGDEDCFGSYREE
jgi:DNA recombination protein Rad52